MIEKWVKAEISKAHFRAPFQTLVNDEEEEGTEDDAREHEDEYYPEYQEDKKIIHRV